jgi:hypothetical protein
MNRDRHLRLLAAADNLDAVADRFRTAAYMEDPNNELRKLVRLLDSVAQTAEYTINDT